MGLKILFGLCAAGLFISCFYIGKYIGGIIGDKIINKYGYH